MSKVLVDRELLEKWADKLEGADSAGYGWEDLLATEVRGVIAQPAEAEGWKLVPVTPTPEMLDAAVDDDQGAKGLRMSLALSNYRAMIAAAPAPLNPLTHTPHHSLPARVGGEGDVRHGRG